MRGPKDRKLWFIYPHSSFTCGGASSVSRTFKEGLGAIQSKLFAHMWHVERDQQSHPFRRLIDPSLCSGFSQDDLLSENLRYVPEQSLLWQLPSSSLSSSLEQEARHCWKAWMCFSSLYLILPKAWCLKPLAPLYTPLHVLYSVY